MSKIFISSVILGFEAYRNAARKAVAGLHHEPIMCEDFFSNGLSPKEACLVGVEQADTVISILGPAFGHEVMPGVSASQLEFETAKKLNKRILVFVQKCEMDERQLNFKKSVENFDDGKFRSSFTNELDLAIGIVSSLTSINISSATMNDQVFIEKIQSTKQRLGYNYRPSEPNFEISFWPTNQRELDLTRFETEIESIVEKLRAENVILPSSNHDIVKAPEWVAIKFGPHHKNSQIYFLENNLILANVDARGDSTNYFSDSTVSPSRARAITHGLSSIFAANSAWIGLSLTRMNFKTMEEPSTDRYKSTTIPMRNDEENRFEISTFLSPFRKVEYLEWCDGQLRKMVRRFGPQSSR